MPRQSLDPKLWLRALSVVINASCFAGTLNSISAMPVYRTQGHHCERMRREPWDALVVEIEFFLQALGGYKLADGRLAALRQQGPQLQPGFMQLRLAVAD